MDVARKSVPITRDFAGERIHDSLAYLEKVGEPLDAWQSDMLARAVAYFGTGIYALAVDAAFRACRPNLYRTRAEVIGLSGGPTVTVAEMRAELDRALAGE